MTAPGKNRSSSSHGKPWSFQTKSSVSGLALRTLRAAFRTTAAGIGTTAAAIILFGLASTPTQAQVPTTDLRVWGFDGIQPLLLRWEAAYTTAHPEVHFHNTLHGSASAMAGLYNGVADIVVMGREIWPVDTMAYHWVFQRQPFGVAVLVGGLNAPAQAFTPIVIVNAKNPLTSLKMEQLDAIYGSEHRAAPTNLRTWGDLALPAPWSTEPIHPYGYGSEDALGVFFRHDVLRGDFKPNPAAHLLSDRDPSPSGKESAARRIAAAVLADPDAIGYTSGLALAPGLKKIPVEGYPSARNYAAPIPATDSTLSNGSYPLTRSLSLFVNRSPGQPLPPAIEGFLRFVLSAPAQKLVSPKEGFLSPSFEQLQEQIGRLDRPMPPEPKGTAAAEDKQ